jgi:hypothetical protein
MTGKAQAFACALPGLFGGSGKRGASARLE